MVSITLQISDEFKQLLQSMKWVNWSEIAREEIQQRIKEEKTLQKLKQIIASSHFTEEDADELAEKVKQKMTDRKKTSNH